MGRRAKFLSIKINTTKKQYIEGAVLFLRNGGKLNSPDVVSFICAKAGLSLSNFYKLYSRSKKSDGKGSVLINFLDDYVLTEKEYRDEFLMEFNSNELDVFERSELLREYMELLEKNRNSYILDKLLNRYELFVLFYTTFFAILGLNNSRKTKVEYFLTHNSVEQKIFLSCLNCFSNDYDKKSLDSLFKFVDKNLEK